MKKLSDNFVYILDGKAYVNLTNRCHNACSFCIRNTGDGVAGTPLWLEREPSADDVMTAFDGVKPRLLKSDEVVFCGYGEPTEALDVLTECAARFKAMGYSTRLNTNGLGSAVHGKNIAPILKNFDTVSVSLNEATAQDYYGVTRSELGIKAFDAVVDFAERCKAEGINTVFTVVDSIGAEHVEACKKLTARLGIPLRVREYISDNYNGGGHA